MNQQLFLHIVERLERFAGKLPASIQQPVLHELTPLKQLFLEQRAPRFVLTGSPKLPVRELVHLLFGATAATTDGDPLVELFRWQTIDLGHGKIELLDARGADDNAVAQVEDEISGKPADVFLHLTGAIDKTIPARQVETLSVLCKRNQTSGRTGKIVGLIIDGRRPHSFANGDGEPGAGVRLRDAIHREPELRAQLLTIVQLDASAVSENGARPQRVAQDLAALLARELPNDVRIELARISRDPNSQTEIARLLVKSTAALCTAIGAQPIPLADLPILTTLQLMMVSGIMYISGRERSLRAATEFVAALGVNVGAGMVLREGARAALKFFPGWGNVVCGMVAGAGTYAIGRAATAYFVEGLSLKDARRTYLASRKERSQRRLLRAKSAQTSVESAR